MQKLFSTPQETTVSLAKISIAKTTISIPSMSVLGFLAGIYIGFGAHLATTVSTGITEQVGFGLTKFFSGAVFSVGLMLVVIAGAELFTGNTLLSVGLLDKKIDFKNLLKNWSVVYISNFVGSVFLAGLIFFAGMNGSGENLTAVGQTAVNIASAKVGLTFMQILLRGILANWLVCLAVVLAVAAKDIVSKIFACFFPIMAFVAMGFEHSVANMYFIPAGMFAAQGTIPSLTVQNAAMNITAATIGNIIGGAFFVGTLYWFVYLKDSK